MSVLIKGMEMPKSLGVTVTIYPDGRVIEYKGYGNYKVCGEATHIPPHGDLIDQDEYRSEFMSGVYDLCDDDPDNNRANAIIDLYDNASAIIQAEEEKHDERRSNSVT